MKRILLFFGLIFSLNSFAQTYPQANTLVTISEENFGKITPNQSNLYFIWNAQGGSFWRLRPNDRTSAASSTIRIHPQGSRFERLNVTGASNVGSATPGVSSITLSQISDFNTVWPPKFSDIQQRPSVYPSDWLTTANRPEMLTNISTYLNQKAPNTRAITAGTGLTGGGDLSIDRSLSVVPNSTVQKTEIYNAGSIVGTRKATNFTSSGTAALTITDDPSNDRVNINISATGGSGGMAEPSTNGMVVRDGAGTSVARTITGSTGISITNGNGVSGNPTIAPANDLLALENLATTGFPKRTATDTWSMGAVDLGTSDVTGTLAAGRMPALTGDITSSAGGTATTYNSVVPANKGGAGAISGLLKANGSGTVSAAIANTDYLTPNGSAASLTNFPTLNQNTTGTAANITGTAAIANGGTGATTAANARTNLGLVIGTDVAPVASPALTGTPTAPTATAGTNTTQISTTAFVKTAVDTRVLIVADVATLKTTTGVSGQIATTSGYYAPNDGGGNSYYWNATSTATQDNGFVIQVTGVSTGRWIATNQSVANVKQFGAKGNGIDDDIIFIQATVNAGNNIFFPAGTYKISTEIVVPSNRLINGEGALSIVRAATNGMTIFQCYHSSIRNNIEISNMTLDGGGGTQLSSVGSNVRNARGINIDNARNIVIHDISIVKFGVKNTANDTIDANYGGMGIQIRARNGASENITVRDVYISDIAGGGMYTGDGIYVEGYNNNTQISLKAIVLERCYVERVGRHCYTIAGDPPYSQGTHVTVRNCYGKNAALSGIDLEDADYSIVENCHFELCGNYTGYYNPTTYYGSTYRLRAAIAYGNESYYNSFRNCKINRCYYGITHGAGDYNLLDNVMCDSSDVADMAVGTARMGENLIIRNSQFVSNLEINFYNGTSNANWLIESSVFRGVLKVSGLKNAKFISCEFLSKIYWTSADNANINFDNCDFKGSDYGIHFNNFSTYVDKIKITKSRFTNNDYGVYAVWQSIKDLSIEDCSFNTIIASVYHANCDNGTPFASIKNNSFDGGGTGISLNQALKYADISGNKFRNISGWCIDNYNIISGTSTTDCIISDNQAVSSVTNGIRISLGTGSWDYVTITKNNMRACSGTKSSFSSGNANGVNNSNFF